MGGDVINNYLQVATIMNFMYIVLDMERILKTNYSMKWRDPEYNFYAKKYQVYQDGQKLYVNWVNLNGERKHLLLNRNPFKSKLLNKLFNVLHKSVTTDDPNRAYNVLTQVVFPSFCKELEIEADFTAVKSSREAADLVMCFLYNNFFCSVSIENFIEMFSLRKLLSNESILYILDTVKKGIPADVQS